jgi:mannose/cellobiose epimerase-like protein (N-acyl-D-glucosamine 2-epimerase family)
MKTNEAGGSGDQNGAAHLAFLGCITDDRIEMARSFMLDGPRSAQYTMGRSIKPFAVTDRDPMSEAASEAEALRRWLFEAALPLWWEIGADRAGGGFHEQIGLDGKPIALPHRARSIARQAISYCEAGRLGWNGPWEAAARHALDYLRLHFTTEDATVVSVVGLDGTVRDATIELYNQAFALLAYAYAHRCFAGRWRNEAVALRATLAHRHADPAGGFREPAGGAPCANPHMHLFEAALAWMAIDDAPEWRTMADDLAALCLRRLIEPATGALHEFFNADWSPAPGVSGRIAEPGHQYEWAFLLDRWAKLTGRERPPAVARLIGFADACGVDRLRNVAINAVLVDGREHDPVARLWAQAERIRAYLIERRAGDDARLAAAIKGLRRFFQTPIPGLWFDRLTAENRFIDEPARATSLYHVVGAVAELTTQSSAKRHRHLSPGTG